MNGSISAAIRDRILHITGQRVLGSSLRRFPRFPCFIPARLTLVERGYGLNGAVTEVSRGGLRFREASTFILDRHGARVAVDLLGATLEGEIVNMSPLGYGIRLSAMLDEDFVETALDVSQT